VCKTYSLALRKGQRLRVYKNELLRRIYGRERGLNRRVENFKILILHQMLSD
jgi:hypothetical protein